MARGTCHGTVRVRSEGQEFLFKWVQHCYNINYQSLLRTLSNIIIIVSSVQPTRWCLEASSPLFLAGTKYYWKAAAVSSSSRALAKLVERSYWTDPANTITIFTSSDLSLNRSEPQTAQTSDLDSWEWVLSKSVLACSDLTTESWETVKSKVRVMLVVGCVEGKHHN